MFTLTTFTPSTHTINFNSLQSLTNHLFYTNKNFEHLITHNTQLYTLSYNQLINLPSNHPFLQ